MHSESYNYLNLTQLLDFYNSFYPIRLWTCCGNTVRIFELSLSFSEKRLLWIGSLTFYVLQHRGNTEAYLELCQTSEMNFYENSSWLLTINHFRKRAVRAVLVYFYVLHLVTERSSHRRWSVKRNVFYKFRKNSQENICAQKKTPGQVFSCELFEIFKNSFLNNTSVRLLPDRIQI